MIDQTEYIIPLAAVSRLAPGGVFEKCVMEDLFGNGIVSGM